VSSPVARRSYWERSQVAKFGLVAAAIAAYLVSYAVAGFAGLINVRGELFSLLLAAVPSFFAFRMGQLWRCTNPVFTRRSGVLALASGRRPGSAGWMRGALLATTELEGVVLYEAGFRGPRPVRLIPHRDVRAVRVDGSDVDSTVRVVGSDTEFVVAGVRLDQAAYFKTAVEARLPAPAAPRRAR
jgi:hypothetical protein